MTAINVGREGGRPIDERGGKGFGWTFSGITEWGRGGGGCLSAGSNLKLGSNYTYAQPK